MEFVEHKCGIAWVNDPTLSRNVTPYADRLAQELENRGGVAVGRATVRHGIMTCTRGNGCAEDVLKAPISMQPADGHQAGINTRYTTCGDDDPELAQPLGYKLRDGRTMSLFFNGNLVNFEELKEALAMRGIPLQADVDTDVIGQLVREAMDKRGLSLMDAVIELEDLLDGAFNLIFMCSDGETVVYRDQHGIHPLHMATVDKMQVVASENSAIKTVFGNVPTQEIKPGELIHYSPMRRISLRQAYEPKPKQCFFEGAYFSKHKSTFMETPLDYARYSWGEALAEGDKEMIARLKAEVREQMAKDMLLIPGATMDLTGKVHLPAEWDETVRGVNDGRNVPKKRKGPVVVPVPDSALLAAAGFAHAAGLPQVDALLKNHEIGRTFTKSMGREKAAELKYELDEELIRGRDIFLVDDSVVRGTTMKALVKRLRKAGARSIHLRLASPPTLNTCYYGIDIKAEDLIARRHNKKGFTGRGVLHDEDLQEIAGELDVDSIRYLPIDDVCIPLGTTRDQLCMACVTGDYPTAGGHARAVREEVIPGKAA